MGGCFYVFYRLGRNFRFGRQKSYVREQVVRCDGFNSLVGVGEVYPKFPRAMKSIWDLGILRPRVGLTPYNYTRNSSTSDDWRRGGGLGSSLPKTEKVVDGRARPSRKVRDTGSRRLVRVCTLTLCLSDRTSNRVFPSTSHRFRSEL